VKIGFDVSQTGRWKAGCGFFADSLVDELTKLEPDDTYVVYPTFGDKVWDPEWATETWWPGDRPNLTRGLAHETYELMQRFWRYPPPDLEELMGSPDIVHANNFFCPRDLRRARLVFTLYDLGFIAHPEWTTEANRLTCFDGVYYASLYADRMIAISAYTKQHFLETFPHYPADRVDVVYPASRFQGPSGIERPASVGELWPRQFWLSVATLEPRKNHFRLLEAYAQLRAVEPETYPLVLVGGKGWLTDDLVAELESQSLTRGVIYLGYVDDPTLSWLYEHCFGFCYLSSFEGFGLPVVEAMSLGAPVITSNLTSIPEIVGDAGIMVDPHELEQVWRSMHRLHTEPDLAARLRQDGPRRARTFAWRTAAQRVREIYADVLTTDAAPATRRSP
jgi:glycosyltransferase involved in cell wall biosynthesis